MADDTDMCLLCAEDQSLFANYECGHNSVCFKCALRVRFQTRYKQKDAHKRLLCLECQSASKTIYICRNGSRGEPRAKNAVKDKKLEGVVGEDADVLQEVQFLRGMYCPLWEKCGNEDEHRSVEDLKAHLSKRHGTTLCGVCYEMRPLFVSEQKLYTPKQLRQHESLHEHCDLDESNFHGHPKCYFCGTLHYDPEQLMEHMYQKHLTCDVCKDRGTVFYKDMRELIMHWRMDHLYCEKCHAQHGGINSREHHPSEWVFATEIDLAAHNNKLHEAPSGRKQGIQIQMGSQSYADQQRRSGYGSQASGERTMEAMPDDHIWFSMGHRAMQSVSLGLPNTRDREQQRSPQRAGRGRGRGLAAEDEAPPPGGAGRGRGRGLPQAPDEPHAPPQTESHKERNIRLMNKIKQLFNNNLKKFNQFRLLSSEFLKGNIQSADYYDQLLVYFGANVDQVFGDLVDLLPDENKQTGLRLVHNTINSKERGVPDPPPPPKTQGIGKKNQQAQAASASESYSTRLRGGATSSLGAMDVASFPTLGGSSDSKNTKKAAKPGPKAGGVWAQRALSRR